MLSFTEENYLKALLHLTTEIEEKIEVGTNELASYLGVKPATATDMLKKLKEKQLISYEKYGKISLSPSGRRLAIEILRKHRLWETFLYEKLEFTWDEVHEVAEQLEHIQSPKLVDKLDKFLGYPEVDPHGDAIPNAKGELKQSAKKMLSEIDEGEACRMAGVKNNTASFLQYVSQLNLSIDTSIKVISKQAYDGSMEIMISKTKIMISQKLAENILVV